MDITDLIKPVTWSESEHQQYESELAEVSGLLRKTSANIYGASDVNRLRTEFLQGKQRLGQYKKAREAMERLLRLEQLFLQAFVLLAKNTAYPFYVKNRKNFALDQSDYEQEALLALTKSCRHFDGRNKFSTYVVNAMKRSLIDVIRQQSQHEWGFGKRLLQERSVVSASLESGVPLSTALLTVSEKDREKLAASFTKVVGLGPDHLTKPSKRGTMETIREDVDYVKSLLPQLSNIKRQLVEAFLTGDNEFRGKMTEEINPNTGRPYTRQWLSTLFKEACLDLRKAAA